MLNTIIGMITAVATASATVLSAISVRQLKNEKKQREKLEEVRLFITPKEKISNCVDEVFFLNLSFTNESSLPISILDIRLFIPNEGNITDNSNGAGGTPVVRSIPVSESKTIYANSDVIVYTASSETLPITLEPFSSSGGYIAFNAGGQDSDIICYKTLLMKIRTSRKSFEIEMDLSCSNFYDFSYRDDGTIFGDACGS